MGELTYRKRTVIKNKVFKEEDILYLARLFEEQFSEGDCERKIWLWFDDESEIIGEDTSIFSTDAFKRRFCKIIVFEYASKSYDNRFKIELSNSAIWDTESKFEVSSTNQVWYESMLGRLETAFAEVKDQRIVRAGGLVAVILGALEAYFLSRFLFHGLSIWASEGVKTLFAVVFTVLFFMINYTALENIKKAFPCVEFSFGPEHRNPVIKKRHVIGLVFPIVIDIVLFLLGLWI